MKKTPPLLLIVRDVQLDLFVKNGLAVLIRFYHALPVISVLLVLTMQRNTLVFQEPLVVCLISSRQQIVLSVLLDSTVFLVQLFLPGLVLRGITAPLVQEVHRRFLVRQVHFPVHMEAQVLILVSFVPKDFIALKLLHHQLSALLVYFQACWAIQSFKTALNVCLDFFVQ
jgi:hypothetical protein